MYRSLADFKHCQSTGTKAMGEKDAHGLQRKHLATMALQTDRWEELLNPHCRDLKCRCNWEIQCSCLKA